MQLKKDMRIKERGKKHTNTSGRHKNI